MTGRTKRELIIEIFETEGFRELSEAECQVINARLVEIHGRGGAATPAYIANTLLAAGKTVRYQESLSEIPPDQFNEDFAGLLNFDTLTAAESSLRAIDRLQRRFHADGNEEG